VAVRSIDDLMNAPDMYKVGDTVTVVILRDDARQTVSVTLQALE
jgi:S1-C subfamily serine protease